MSLFDELHEGLDARTVELRRLTPASPPATQSAGQATMNPLSSFFAFVCLLAAGSLGYFVNLYLGLAFAFAAVVITMSVKMANVWQKFVILRLGKLQSVRGTGCS